MNLHESSYSDAVVSNLVAIGAFPGERPPPSSPPPAPAPEPPARRVARALDGTAYTEYHKIGDHIVERPIFVDDCRPWQPPPPRDPWTRKDLLDLAENPLGLEIAQSMYVDGAIGDDELSVVKELFNPFERIAAIEVDPYFALDLASEYRLKGILDDVGFEKAARLIARQTLARGRAADAEMAAEDRRFAEEAEVEELKQRADDVIREKGYEIYEQTVDAMSAPEQDEQQEAGEASEV